MNLRKNQPQNQPSMTPKMIYVLVDGKGINSMALPSSLPKPIKF
jgi:hypothetical protein